MNDPHGLFPSESDYDRAVTVGNGQYLWQVLALFEYEPNDALREAIYDFARGKIRELREET